MRGRSSQRPDRPGPASPGRRNALRILGATPFAFAAHALGGCEDTCDAPASASACEATASDVEGPFYRADAPVRATLAEADEAGEPIVIRGRIVDASDCNNALGGYVLDLWHTDDAGRYDNDGHHLRGKITAEPDGSFAIHTILPGSYPDRPQRHIHVKVRRPDGDLRLTTQIYFEGDPNLDCSSVGPRVLLTEGEATLDLVVTA